MNSGVLHLFATTLLTLSITAARAETSTGPCETTVVRELKSREYWMIGEFYLLQGRITFHKLAHAYLVRAVNEPSILERTDAGVAETIQGLVSGFDRNDVADDSALSERIQIFRRNPYSRTALAQVAESLTERGEGYGSPRFSRIDARFLLLLSDAQLWKEGNARSAAKVRILNPLRMIRSAYRGLTSTELGAELIPVAKEIERLERKRDELLDSVERVLATGSDPNGPEAPFAVVECLRPSAAYRDRNERYFDLTKSDVKDRRYRGLRIGNVSLKVVHLSANKAARGIESALHNDRSGTPVLGSVGAVPSSTADPKKTSKEIAASRAGAVPKTIGSTKESSLPGAPAEKIDRPSIRPYLLSLNEHFGLTPEEHRRRRLEGEESEKIFKVRFIRASRALAASLDLGRGCVRDATTASAGNLAGYERVFMAYFIARKNATLPVYFDEKSEKFSSPNIAKRLAGCLARISDLAETDDRDSTRVYKASAMMVKAMDVQKIIATRCGEKAPFSADRTRLLAFASLGKDVLEKGDLEALGECHLTVRASEFLNEAAHFGAALNPIAK